MWREFLALLLSDFDAKAHQQWLTCKMSIFSFLCCIASVVWLRVNCNFQIATLLHLNTTSTLQRFSFLQSTLALKQHTFIIERRLVFLNATKYIQRVSCNIQDSCKKCHFFALFLYRRRRRIFCCLAYLITIHIKNYVNVLEHDV